MLIVILGAGASYDSDPDRARIAGGYENRPPLAAELFDGRAIHQDAIAAFDRCVPAVARARRDVAAGASVEDSLGVLQARALSDPRARSELMAIRFYLQRVLTEGPAAWVRGTSGLLTNYVTVLDHLAQWTADKKGREYCLISFNYDLMLEQARSIVYGEAAHARNIHSYNSPAVGPRLYKPHGSVNWGRAARWGGPNESGDNARRSMIETPPTPTDLLDEWQVAPYLEGGNVVTTLGDPTLGTQHTIVWHPVLAIPVEAKPEMVMPAEHQDSLRADLRKATSVLTIGWRGREAHFVKELTNCLPAGLPLVAVAENEEAAQETTDHLLATGRFDAYCNVGGGFSKFAPMETTYSHDKSPAKAPTLGAMLRDLISYRASVDGRVRVTMQPQLPVVRAPYVDFPGRAGTR